MHAGWVMVLFRRKDGGRKREGKGFLLDKTFAILIIFSSPYIIFQYFQFNIISEVGLLPLEVRRWCMRRLGKWWPVLNMFPVNEHECALWGKIKGCEIMVKMLYFIINNFIRCKFTLQFSARLAIRRVMAAAT